MCAENVAASRDAAAIASPFRNLVGQERVQGFLEAAWRQGSFSHASLFVGPAGSGRMQAARDLAQALLCPTKGCGSCETCQRIARDAHPDVHVVEPEGVGGYLAEQVRELIHDVSLAPVQAQGKVYVITRADLLRGAPANAFLKTLEEPPERVCFVLIAPTRESVMETVRSRAQVVAFRSIPEQEVLTIVCAQTGATRPQARIASAVCAGNVMEAVRFIQSPTRMQLRLAVIDRLEHLRDADELSVLHAARDLLAQMKLPLDQVKAEFEVQETQARDYLSKGALNALEKRHKRELSQKERRGMVEVCAVMRTWLRDCLVVSAGCGDLMVNTDCYSNIERMAAQTSSAALAKAVEAVDEALQHLDANVSSQLVLETCLLKIKEAFDALGE